MINFLILLAGRKAREPGKGAYKNYLGIKPQKFQPYILKIAAENYKDLYGKNTGIPQPLFQTSCYCRAYGSFRLRSVGLQTRVDLPTSFMLVRLRLKTRPTTIDSSTLCAIALGC